MAENNDDFNSDFTSISQKSPQQTERRHVKFRDTPEVFTAGNHQIVPAQSSAELMKSTDATLEKSISDQKKSFKIAASKIQQNFNNKCNTANEAIKAGNKGDSEKLQDSVRGFLRATKTTVKTFNTNYDNFEEIDTVTKYLEHKAKAFENVLKEIEDL